jgi:hypothetical protein
MMSETLNDAKVGDTVRIDWEGKSGEAVVLARSMYCGWKSVLLGWKTMPIAAFAADLKAFHELCLGADIDESTLLPTEGYRGLMGWYGLTDCTILPAQAPATDTVIPTNEETSILGTLVLGLLALGGAALSTANKATGARVVSEPLETTAVENEPEQATEAQ